MKNEVALTPRHIASVSGGKDSLFMLKYIIEHPEEYPLDEVVYFDLEIDYPFIKNVIEEIRSECVKLKIPFRAIKPEKSWNELYETHLYPTRKNRWCNGLYKLNCRKQFEKEQIKLGFRAIWYIGYCVDEIKRYNNRKNAYEKYPLVEIGIEEKYILDWARKQRVYNKYYLTNDRCGCIGCPMQSYITWAYMYKYYPEQYNDCIEKMKYTEKIREKELGKPFSIIQPKAKYNTDYLDNIVKSKWVKKLEEKENSYM